MSRRDASVVAFVSPAISGEIVSARFQDSILARLLLLRVYPPKLDTSVGACPPRCGHAPTDVCPNGLKQKITLSSRLSAYSYYLVKMPGIVLDSDEFAEKYIAKVENRVREGVDADGC